MGTLKNGTFCPLIKKDCIGLTCAWYTRVQGVDVNTGNQVDSYECAISWLPMLLVENSGQQRQTGAAVESFRNEMVRSNEKSQEILIATSKISQIKNKEEPKLIQDIQDI
jgi:hypothetical protein